MADEEEDTENFCFCTGIERGVKAEEWVVDSGATTHMTWDKGVFVTFAALHDMPSVRLGDGRTVKAEGKGSVRLCVRDNYDAECVIRLSSVLLVPDLSCNLFPVRDITDKGNRMLFDDVACSIISKDNSVIASGHKRGNLYVLDGTADRKPDEAMVAAQPTSNLWHQRLAHVNDKVLQKIVSCDVAGVDLKKAELRSFSAPIFNRGQGVSAQGSTVRTVTSPEGVLSQVSWAPFFSNSPSISICAWMIGSSEPRQEPSVWHTRR